MVIAGNDKNGYSYVNKGIFDKWAELGFYDSGLGKPITNLMSNKNSGIEWQEFEHGFIVGNKAHGYFISMGPTREVWVKQKWEFGPLGFPQSDIIMGADGIQKQTYEGGTIFYSKKSGAYSTLN